MMWFKGVAALALTSLSLVACAGDPLGPGKYVVLEVAYGQPIESSECNAATLTSTTVKSSGAIALYAAGEGLFADLGTAGGNNDVTLQGKQGDGDAYTFTGKTATLTNIGPPNNRISVTVTQTYTMNLKFDGSTATGSVKSSFSCSSSSTACDNVQPPNGCTVTTSFSGERVDDVDLQHNL
jgi:hypothetical protein